MKRINFHRAISLILAMCLALGCAPLSSVAADTELLSENFETGTPGQDVSDWNGWVGAYGNETTTITQKDSVYTIEQDPQNTSNKVLQLYRPTSTSASRDYSLSKELSQTVTSGIVSVSFKLQRINSASEYFRLRVCDKNSKEWDITVNMKTALISAGASVYLQENGEALNTTQLNKWYNIEFHFDLTGEKGKLLVYQDGKLLKSNVDFPATFTKSIKKVGIGTHRSSAGAGAKFLVDDVVAKKLAGMELISHTPSNNESNVDINEKIELNFSQNIDSDELENANILINNEEPASVLIDTQDSKKLIVTPSSPFAFTTEYTVLVSGVKDIYGQTAPDKSFSFTSRSGRMYFEEPKFYLDYEGEKTLLVNTQTASGIVTAEISAVKETTQNADVLLMMETLRSGERVSLCAVPYQLSGGNTLPQTITISNSIEEGDVLRISILDNWTSLKPYVGSYTFDEGGLSLASFDKETEIKEIHAYVDYQAQTLEISGITQVNEATALIALLAPGYEASQITPLNVNSAVSDIFYVTSDSNGDFTAQIDVSSYEKGEKYTLIGSGGKSFPFLIGTNEQLNTALGKVASADEQELIDLLAGEEELQTGILLNDILGLDLAEYMLLIEAEKVVQSLAGVTFTNVKELREAYYDALEQQVSDEVRIKEALEQINTAAEDDMESILKSCDDVIAITWNTDFTLLNSADKEILYENMASQTFKKPKEVEDAFKEHIEKLISKKIVVSKDGCENIFAEDFNSAEATIGIDVLGWREWSGGYNNATETINVRDSYIKIAQDSENPANKVLKAYRTTCSANSIYYTVEKTLPEIQSKGVIRYGMKIKRMNSSTSILRLSMIDHKEIYWDITFVMDSSRINCGGSTVNFSENSGDNPPAAINEWYFFDLFFDMDNKKLSVYQNGELLGKDIGFPTNFSGGLQKFGIGPHRSGAGSNSEFLVDDITVDKVKPLKMEDSLPKKDAQDFDTDKKIKLIFNHKIDAASLLTADVTIGNASVKTVSLDAQNPDTVLIETTSPLNFNTSYTVSVSGIKDIYGQSAPDESFSFKTRKRRLLFKDVRFFTDYEGSKGDITQSGLVAGEITAELKLVNEEGTSENLLILLETEQSGKTQHIEVKPYTVLPDSTTEQTVTVSSNAQRGNTLRLMIIDSWADMESYASLYTFDKDGLSTENAADTEKIHASVNYQTNKLEITGKAQNAQSTAIAAVLKNGYTAETITALNVNDVVCELLQLQSDANGQYAMQIDVSGYETNVAYSVIASDKKTLPFKISTVDLITAALDKVKTITKEELAAMLAGNPLLAAGIPINDVLQLDLSEYNTLSSKVDVTKDVAGKNFNNLNELRAAYYSALQRQVTYENRVKEIIKTVNDALWDGFENALKNGSDLLQINWSGDYSKLNETYNGLLYKALAKDYTFTTLKQIEDTFAAKATELYTEQSKTDGSDDGTDGGNDLGGGGGGGGGVSGPVITEPIQMQKGEAFTDLDAVPWAKESINALSAKGIINGVGDNKFAPNDTVTREQFVKMMVVAFKLEGKDTSGFADVDSSAWYAPYIGAAVQNKIINGISAECFGVGSNITRSDIAVICTRIAKKCSIALPEASEPIYTDAHSIPDYAKESAAVLQLAGIMTGDGSGCFAPKEYATRAMAAKIIHMLMTLTSVQ